MGHAVPLIIAEEPLTRLGMRHFLGDEAGMRACLEAVNATEALRQQAEHRPALVILFAGECPVSTVRLIRDLRRRCRTQAVLVVSRVVECEHVQSCLSAGALGYVTSGDEFPELRLACAAVLGGDLHVSRRAARCLASGRGAKVSPGLKTGVSLTALSEREREVFHLIGQGRGCKELAGQLGISVKTVETHQQRIKDKLEVLTCAELKRLATEMCGR